MMNRQSFPGSAFRLNRHDEAVGRFDHPEDAAGRDRSSRRPRHELEGHGLSLESTNFFDVHAANPPPVMIDPGLTASGRAETEVAANADRAVRDLDCAHR